MSTSSDRALIGDDEHGWDDDGVFNFEGGCYAKTIDLSATKEPEISAAIRRDALLENVVMRDDGSLDFSDGSITENTRVSYPLTHIENIVRPVSRGGHAKRVIFLTADAFGVLPAVSLLDDTQAQYHFCLALRLSLPAQSAALPSQHTCLFCLFWCSIFIPASNPICQNTHRAASGLRRTGLFGEYRMERHGRAHFTCSYAEHYLAYFVW